MTGSESLSLKCPEHCIWSLSKAFHIYKEPNLRNSLRQLTFGATKVPAFPMQRTNFVLYKPRCCGSNNACNGRPSSALVTDAPFIAILTEAFSEENLGLGDQYNQLILPISQLRFPFLHSFYLTKSISSLMDTEVRLNLKSV